MVKDSPCPLVDVGHCVLLYKTLISFLKWVLPQKPLTQGFYWQRSLSTEFGNLPATCKVLLWEA